jgi:hypothetical protein
MGPPMVQAYTDLFSESELRAYLAFYRTPAGRSLARQTPELSRRGAAIGATVAEKYGAELTQSIQARMMELQAKTKTP